MPLFYRDERFLKCKDRFLTTFALARLSQSIINGIQPFPCHTIGKLIPNPLHIGNSYAINLKRFPCFSVASHISRAGHTKVHEVHVNRASLLILGSFKPSLLLRLDIFVKKKISKAKGCASG